VSIGSSAIVEAASGGTVIASGTVTNSGTLFASGASSRIAIIGVVRGGTAEVDDGVVDVTNASSEAAAWHRSEDSTAWPPSARTPRPPAPSARWVGVQQGQRDGSGVPAAQSTVWA
jgi:hypothetical protein